MNQQVYNQRYLFHVSNDRAIITRLSENIFNRWRIHHLPADS